MKIIVFLLSGWLLLAGTAIAQNNAPDNTRKRIDKLASRNNTVVKLLTTTAGGKDINVITTGTGNADEKPAIAVIGGVEGSARYSVDLVLSMAEDVAGADDALTDEVTFYFFPDMTPDAGDAFYSTPAYERQGNAVPFDDDKDGKTDEDGYDDLNGDGLITWMRIHDTIKGQWMVHPDNPYVMVKADPSANEKGEYIVMREGFDNDKDGNINEDLPGGTVFNKNFTFNYKAFTKGSGLNPVSEIETRALARFLFDHWNIFAVVIIGPDNNLTAFNNLKVSLNDKSIPAEVSKGDKTYFEKVVNIYNRCINLPEKTVCAPDGGDLLSWSYFHFNRFAFSTPAWNSKIAKNDHGSLEYDFLSAIGVDEMSGKVVKWETVVHSDFENNIVEVGGLKPFVVENPPTSAMDSLADGHRKFLKELAALHPAMSITSVRVIDRGDHIYQIEAEITNSGGLPTMTELAVDSRWVKKVRIDLVHGSDNILTGGPRTSLYDRIVPGETKKLNWIVKGRGEVTLKMGSPQTGYVNRSIKLN